MIIAIALAAGFILGFLADRLHFHAEAWRVSRKLQYDLFGGKVTLFRR